jgi:prepilin-type N-terminal cleavage/methylation domain-containing protein
VCLVHSEDDSSRSRGSTLIEVVVAMLILAIGLLGLEALGVRASRSIALADRQSMYATIASDSLESALDQLRRQWIPTQFCQTDLPFGDRMSRSVDLSTPGVATVLIRIIPNPASIDAPANPFEITSSLFLQVPLVGAAGGQTCS